MQGKKQHILGAGFYLLVFIVIAGVVGMVYLFNNVSQNSEKEISKKIVAQTTIAEKAVIQTNFGDIEIQFFKDKAPLTVENFIKLAESGFYNDTLFHRVIKDFMIQGGDPITALRNSDWSLHGTGGPGYTFADEINNEPIVRGVIAMANSGPNTNGSQFFIVTADAAPWLDGRHTVFGRVTRGMNVVDKIEAMEINEKDHPLRDVVVKGIFIQ